ncbi:MAG: elongation factor P hydroxylase [Pseudomonadales bacterium]|nr:elongation factor P hydroxylase [Pseudomonadales bacterium]
MASEHNPDHLIAIFNQCFLATHNTRLVRGGDEPVYLPAGPGRPQHELHFAHGFFRSALHEISHWLIAGEARRQLADFGYWYQPDGRDARQQREFERVEVKPQALEWILCRAAGVPFQVSLDNLNGEATDAAGFKQAVRTQVLDYLQQGLNQRAETLRLALCRHYGTRPRLDPADFASDPR